MARRIEESRAELPCKFIVAGIPRSSQAGRSRRLWMAKVREAAVAAWSDDTPLDQPVSVVVVYFFKQGGVDVDNMVKPILDALKGVILSDDRQVSQVLARNTELVADSSITGADPDLARAIDGRTDFVYVRVDHPPDHGVMP